ncbi:DUF4922 domain-containing protein [Draconibacterium sp.]|nr:DUF4922 domain-containing protein [Draconibacterium sp.]
MLQQKTISLKELAKFGSVKNMNEQALALINQQRSVWDIVEKNFDALNRVNTKTFDFINFKIIVQFNPERIRSSVAKTDTKAIAARPCFLCLKNLPAEQKGIIFQNNYFILTNPFPIFQKHLTISKFEHSPQLIQPYISDMLELSKELTDFTVFYNGPQCGASAPDHFHFQAGIKGLLPIEAEFANLENNYSEIIFQTNKTKIIAVENYLRPFVAVVSNNNDECINQTKRIITILDNGKFDEPLLNILCNFENGKWRIIIFPRVKQRSSHFFRTDNKQIIASPAAVELGGVFVLPREEDFRKITQMEITEIYEEVAINKDDFEILKRKINE